MRRIWCAGGLLGVSILLGQPAARATTLLPGQTLSTATLTSPDGVAEPVRVGGTLAAPGYDLAPTGEVENQVAPSDGIGASMVTDAQQHRLAAYELIPVEGLPPPNPLINYQVAPLPTDAVLRIPGFGTSAVDVSSVVNSDGLPSIDTISRSADGDVISLTGFTMRRNPSGAGLPLFISDPSVTFGVTDGTLSFVGLDGAERTFSVQVLGGISGTAPVPEPSVMSMLAISCLGLWGRFRKR